MRIVPLGGAEEIGASCTFIELGGRRLIVDCGIRTGNNSRDDPLPNLSHLAELGGVDAIIVTHAHLDHSGALPVLHQSYPGVPVYATPATHALVGVMLRDALKVMGNRFEREQEVPLYAPEAVDSLVTRFVPIRFCDRTPILQGDVAVTLFPAGHVLGAAMVALEAEDGRVLVTGDYSVSPQRTVEGLLAPRFRPDVLVTESTYGDRMHANRNVEERRLAETVAAVVEGGGKALIPAFALGRAQEVILILQQFQRDGAISRFPVWVDGMVKNICGVYGAYSESLSQSFRQRQKKEGAVFFRPQDGFDAVVPTQREAIVGGGPCAIVSSSGMLTGGPSLFYARNLAPDSRSAILITGYQDEESPGRRLLDLSRADQEDRTLLVDGQAVPVECRVDRYGLSAHADSGEMAGLVSRLRPNEVVLVHGGGEARARLASLLGQERRVHLPSACDEMRFVQRHRHSVAVGFDEHPAGNGKPLDDAALRKVRDDILESPARDRAFTVEELAQRWCGAPPAQHEVQRLREALTDNKYLVPDRKRPFLYRASTTTPAVADPQAPLEQNAALGVVAELFGECSDLYRKGAYPERRTLMLSFHFPRTARQRYQEKLRDLAERTRWEVALTAEEHLGALASLVRDLCPGWTPAREPSYHREENLMRARLHVPAEVPLEERRKRARAFEERSGVRLEILDPPAGTPLPAATATAAGQPLEINLAYATVERLLTAAGAALYRRGKKVDAATGEAYIEVAFISPAVGERFRPALEATAREVGWPLRIYQEANQTAVKEAARRLIPAEWGLQREPGFFGHEGCVRARVRVRPDAGALSELSARLVEETGFRLEVET